MLELYLFTVTMVLAGIAIFLALETGALTKRVARLERTLHSSCAHGYLDSGDCPGCKVHTDA